MGIIIFFSYIFICYGLSNMIVYSNGPFHIFAKWREITEKIGPKFSELFTCMMCFPFWAGVLFSLLDLFVFKFSQFTPFNLILDYDGLSAFGYVLIVLFDGALSSGTTWLIHNIEEYYENK